MTALLNDLADIGRRILLVLDDYHAAAGEEVDQAVALLVDCLPPHLHVAIFTRVEPELPLARYRARGQVVELRAGDLCFDLAEAADFLGRTMDLTITEDELASLEQRTEGWIAGLQLAALSLRGRRDTAAFISSFAGSHRFVLDYLVEEVLLRETAEVRDFLMRTSILDELCVLSAKEVAGSATAGRCWMPSSGPTFSSCPSTTSAGGTAITPCSRKPSARAWPRSGRQRSPPCTAGRAPGTSAKDSPRTRSVTRSRPGTSGARRVSSSCGGMRWISNTGPLPGSTGRGSFHERSSVRGRCGQRGLRMGPDRYRRPGGERGAVPRRGEPVRWMLVADEEQYRSLPSSIAVARAYRALASGDIPGTVDQARRASTLAPAGDHLRRSAATSLLGLALYAEGDLQAADTAMSSCISIARTSGRFAEALGMVFLLAEIEVSLGRLRDAERACADALRLAAEREEPIRHVTADLHRAMSEILLERGDLEAAGEELRIARDHGEEASSTDWRYRVSKTEARAAEARGDFQGALELLDEAERFHIRTPLPEVRPVDAMRARIWTRLGDAAKALAWAGGGDCPSTARSAFSVSSGT